MNRFVAMIDTYQTMLWMDGDDRLNNYPDSKIHGANMGPIWGRQVPRGPIVGPMKFAIWVFNRYGDKFDGKIT